MNSLWLSPHNDDETLFGAFTLLRKKPLVVVVTDSWIQYNRGESIVADQRWEETVEAMKILGCPVLRLGIRDDVFDEWLLRSELKKFANFDNVYAPAIQGGNNQHDSIGDVADQIFGKKCKHYTTYTKTENYTKGNEEIVPTEEEFELKKKALNCYATQLNNTNKVYFDAVIEGRSEWFM